MKLLLLIISFTTFIVNAMPVAEPVKAACYFDPVDGKEHCSHPTPVVLPGWPTPAPTLTSTEHRKRAVAECWFDSTTTHCHAPPLTTSTPTPSPVVEKRQCMVLFEDADGTLHQKCGTSVIACKDGTCNAEVTDAPTGNTITIDSVDATPTAA